MVCNAITSKGLPQFVFSVLVVVHQENARLPESGARLGWPGVGAWVRGIAALLPFALIHAQDSGTRDMGMRYLLWFLFDNLPMICHKVH